MSEGPPVRQPEATPNPDDGRALLAAEATFVKPEKSKLLIVTGPWTKEARADAARIAVKGTMQRYFTRAMKERNWTPWDDFKIGEMQALGHLLSEDTVTLTQAYLGVEDYVGDYVEDGLKLFGKQRERRNIHLLWGAEEAKHAEAWESVLLHSGRKTEKELSDYRDQVATHTWTMREEHPGLDTPHGVIAYAMLQERATYFNYEEMRKRIRSEYGLDPKSTPDERQRDRGMQIGAAGAFQTVGRDEIAHHGLFLELTQIYTRYQPEQMLDALVKVFRGFTMPATDLIPNSVDLEAAMRATKLHTPRKQITEVNNPILNALGVDNKRALEVAAQRAKILPGSLGPGYVGIGKDGEFVLSMTPDPQVEEKFPQSGVLFEKK